MVTSYKKIKGIQQTVSTEKNNRIFVSSFFSHAFILHRIGSYTIGNVKVKSKCLI